MTVGRMRTGAAWLLTGLAFHLAGGRLQARPPWKRRVLRQESSWIRSRGPGGTSVLHPRDYRAVFGPRGRLRVLGDRGKLNLSTPFVLALPVIAFPGESALAYLERAHLPGFLSLPGARVVRKEELDPGRASILVEYPLQDIYRKALLYCALRGGTGMAYVLSAPSRGFDLLRPGLARIAESIRYGSKEPGPAGEGGPPPGRAFLSWTEPVEGAFTIRVPARWKVEGSLVKRGPLDFAPTVRLTSPDGKLEVFLGDRRCSYFVEPDPELLATGFQEGRWYSSSWGGSLRVLAYRPGCRFVREYLFRPPFEPEGLEIRREAPLPGMAAGLAGLLRGLDGTTARVDAGFLLFESKGRKTRLTGFTICVTLHLAPRKRKKIWRPLLLAGWRALPGKEITADRVLQEVLRSFRMDPAWIASQPGLVPADRAIQEEACRAAAAWLAGTRERRLTTGGEKGARHPSPPGPGGWRIARGRNYYWAPPLSPAPPDLDLSPLEGDEPEASSKS